MPGEHVSDGADLGGQSFQLRLTLASVNLRGDALRLRARQCGELGLSGGCVRLRGDLLRITAIDVDVSVLEGVLVVHNEFAEHLDGVDLRLAFDLLAQAFEVGGDANFCGGGLRGANLIVPDAVDLEVDFPVSGNGV